MYQNKIFLISTLFLLGCAGPMSPFGAINTDSDQTLEEFEATHKTTNSSHTVVFSPDRQVLHDQSNLDIKINSSDSIGDAHLFKIYYNSRDVTKTYLELSKKGIEVEANKMELEFKNLRLPASKFHKIVIAFQPSPTSSLVLAKYLPPACTKSEKMEIQSTLKFDPPSEYLKHIKHVTSQNGLNPNLLAGLIAQESGFDPRALSWAKAIGLTQVTAVADEEIQKYKPNWPRYNKGKKMSLTKVKALIASGKMNSTNEWRLNPQMSIEGGAVYLNYLNDYWEKPENQELIKSVFSDYEMGLTTVLLASYNSGASRVKKSLQNHGKDWIMSSELTEARKYVNSIMSYCYHFSKRET